MSAKEQIKILLAKEDIKLKELAEMLSEKLNKKLTPSNLSHKINKGLLRFNEAEAIAEILGYKLEFTRND